MKRLALWFAVGYLLSAGVMGLAAAPVPAAVEGPKATLEVMALTATPLAARATESARRLGVCREYAAKAASAP